MNKTTKDIIKALLNTNAQGGESRVGDANR